MHISSFISKKKTAIKNYVKRRRLKIASLEETIEKMATDKCSISRYGDGEFYLMDGKGIIFQEKDELLAKRLQDIMQSSLDGHLICIGGGCNPKNYKEFTKGHKKAMRNYFRCNTELRFKYMPTENSITICLLRVFGYLLRTKQGLQILPKH